MLQEDRGFTAFLQRDSSKLFPLTIAHKDNRHAGVLGPSRDTECLLKDHLDATSHVTCAPPSYVDPGCHCMQKLPSYPFKGHRYSTGQKIYPIYCLFLTAPLICITEIRICAGKTVQASNPLEYRNGWREHPT